jgi:hypothetical protein
VPKFITKHFKQKKQLNFLMGKISTSINLTSHSRIIHNFFLVKSHRVKLEFIKLQKFDSPNLGF